ncbi:glycerophosphoryl diester phosphodiesterase membrane domain-containing protein [Lentzea sp. NPDC102401]|uniref:glycerophosphoryl diester phosphodiesterase membrane domain-containing protein n=1 Tax=Lentzea sp. NPDC102401 TaxID=3364128 RepID=UPI00381D551A
MSETPGWSSPDQPNQQPPQQPQYGYNAPPPPVQPTIKPGVIPLRPLAVGEIVDGAITTMRRYPKQIIGVAAVVAAVTQIVGLLVQLPFLDDLTAVVSLDPNTMTPEQVADQFTSAITGFLTGALLSVVLALIGTVFLSGYITVVVGHAVLGKQVTFGEAWAEFKPRLLPLLGATLLLGLAFTLLPILFLLPGIAMGSGPTVVLGIVICIPLVIWLWVRFALVTPALVLERCGVGTAFGRSQKLVSGAWWRTFGILLLAFLITIVIEWIIGLPFGLLGAATTGFSDSPAAALSAGSLTLSTIGGVIASTITLPFSAAVTVLLYVDRRMRSEGMDIELQRAAGHGGS